MKKVLLLAILLIITNLGTQNYCAAQAKIKPENCTYFQIIIQSKIIEWVCIGSDRSEKNKKWLELDNSKGATEYIETDRDEWSIYLKALKGNSNVQIDLYQMILTTVGKTFKIINVKDKYDYSKLVEPYNRVVEQKKQW